MDRPVEIRLKQKYLHHEVKKISRRDSTTGRRRPNKNGLPSPALGRPRHERIRVLHMRSGTGKRSWRWQ